MSTEAPEGPRRHPGQQSSSSNGAPIPRAWTSGTNPVTQRSNTPSSMGSTGNGNGHGHRRPAVPIPDKHAHDRLLFLLTYMTGLEVIVAMKNGDTYTGVFSNTSVSQAKAATYTLKMVRKVDAGPAEFVGDGEDHIMTVRVDEVVDLTAAGVSLGSQSSRAANGFRTDVEISGNLEVRERILQKWEPAEGGISDMSLGIDGAPHKAKWDQFKANEKLYNVRSDYNEDIYTTTIDRSDPEYARRAQKAARLAAEIEGQSVRNKNEVDAGLDEEDKYSGVRRDTPTLGKSGPGAYVPPSKRAITNTPTVPGAPYDPAIISSQIARPGQTNTQAETLVATDDPLPKTTGPHTSLATAMVTPRRNSGSRPASVVAQPAPGKTAAENGQDIMRNVTDAFKQFNQSEKLRLQQQQRQQQQQRANSAKQEKSVKLNDLRKFSQNFKLHSRVPDDLVPILAKSKEKQDEIVARAEKEAQERQSTAASPSQQQHAVATSAQSTAAASEASRPVRSQQQRMPKIDKPVEIPPFSGRASASSASRQQQQARPTASGTASTAPSKPTTTQPPVSAAVLSPASSAVAPRLNVKAMEFRPNPTASTFAPGGLVNNESKRPSIASPAPVSNLSSPTTAEFFPANTRMSKLADMSDDDLLANSFSILANLRSKTATAEGKDKYASNGGIPPGYRTVPTWECDPANENRSYIHMFPSTFQGRSAIHAGHSGAMPHQHQLPLHLQNGPGQAHRSPQLHRSQPQGQFDDKRMQFSPSSSMHSLPSMGQSAMGYPGQAQMIYPYANGMSPNMRMRPLPSGAQYMTPQGAPMGGHMMVPQGSNGPYSQQGVYMYSPGPTHAQPHHGGQHGQANMPGAFGSPRAHPMNPQGSQQGHMPQQMFGAPGQTGPMMMMMPQHGGPVAPSRGYGPGQYGGQHQGPYGIQQRTASNGGYSHNSTARPGHQLPHSQSLSQIPATGGATGDADTRRDDHELTHDKKSTVKTQEKRS